MNRDDVMQALTEHIVRERLQGDAGELDETTPLLGWGILDSISVAELVLFIEKRWGIAVPPDEVTAANLATLAALTALVVRLAGGAAPPRA